MTASDRLLPRIFLQPGQDRRIAGGHPWAFSNEIRMDEQAKAIPPGSLATLHRTDGKPLGIGTFNPHALIGFRLFDRDASAVVDRYWLARRLRAALALRQRFYDRPYYRLVHGEADGLPGLVVDRFADVLVVQANTAGMEQLTGALLAAVDDVVAPATIVLRNDSKGRPLEGRDSAVTVAKGSIDDPIELDEDGVRFCADVLAGQKTGWFFDQSDNRRTVARLAAGATVLDLYTHSGGFAVGAAVHGATAVLAIDSSDPALALARRAAAANGVDARCTFKRGEVFGELERLHGDGQRFGIVAADPPAFVRTRKDIGSGRKGYRKLVRLAAPLVEPGGLLFIASCSHPIDAPMLLDEVARGIEAAGRGGRVLRQVGAGPDHPVHPQLPETAYLKTLLLQLD